MGVSLRTAPVFFAVCRAVGRSHWATYGKVLTAAVAPAVSGALA